MKKLLFSLCLFLLVWALSGCGTNAAISPDVELTEYVMTIDELEQHYSTAALYTQSPVAEGTVPAAPTQMTEEDISPTTFPAHTLTPTGAPCYRARVLNESPAPYYDRLALGESFVKTWTLLNTGSCRWPAGVQLVYVQVEHNLTADILDQMSGLSPQPIGVDVGVGETVNVSVALVAPLSTGQYAGYWMLRNTYGGRFGQGLQGEAAFSVTLLMRMQPPTRSTATSTSVAVHTAVPTETKIPSTSTSALPSVTPVVVTSTPAPAETPTATLKSS